MLFFRIAVDQDVVNVRSKEDIHHTMKYVINIILNREQDIRQSKQNNKIFYESIASPEYSFLLLTILDLQATIGDNNVDFAEDFSFAESFQRLFNQQQRVTILNHYSIHLSIVNIETEVSCLLGKKNWRCR